MNSTILKTDFFLYSHSTLKTYFNDEIPFHPVKCEGHVLHHTHLFWKGGRGKQFAVYNLPITDHIPHLTEYKAKYSFLV
jgi:hypothetical protein